MSSTEGRAGVVAEAVNGAVSEIARADRAADGEQLEAFALPTKFADGDPRRGEQLERARRAGRPAGAVNRSTKAFREYLLARGVNPLEQMMRWALHTPESLSTELACTQLEAFRELKSLWGELAPYFAAKVAPTDDAGRTVPQIMMVFGGAGAPGGAPGAPPWAYLEGERNQPVSEAPPEVSHGAVSHGVAK